MATHKERKMTEKGLLYTLHLDVTDKELKRSFKSLEGGYHHIEGRTNEEMDLTVIREQYTDWMMRYKDYLLVKNRFMNMLPSEPQFEHYARTKIENDKLLAKYRLFIESKLSCRPKSPIIINRSATVQDISPDESVSQISKNSAKSKHSSNSSSVSDARIKSEQKKAELLARGAALRKKQELELQKFQIKLKEDELELRTELAVEDAKGQALAALERGTGVSPFDNESVENDKGQVLAASERSTRVSSFAKNVPRDKQPILPMIMNPLHPESGRQHVTEAAVPPCTSPKNFLDSVTQEINHVNSASKQDQHVSGYYVSRDHYPRVLDMTDVSQVSHNSNEIRFITPPNAVNNPFNDMFVQQAVPSSVNLQRKLPAYVFDQDNRPSNDDMYDKSYINQSFTPRDVNVVNKQQTGQFSEGIPINDFMNHEFARQGRPNVNERNHDVIGSSPVFYDGNPVRNQFRNDDRSMLYQGRNDDVMLKVIKEMRKPNPEIKKFSGDPLDYRKFMRQFHAKIVANTDNNDEKMTFLEQFTVGEANRIVQGYAYLDANIGYDRALQELEQRYGDVDVVANAFVNKALEWPIIVNDKPKALDICNFSG